MFYFIVNKMLSIINDDSKTMKVIIIGSMCYIILHAFLFSKYNENSELIQKFRDYIYYLFMADAVLTSGYVWMFEKPKQIEDSDELDSDNSNAENDKESSEIKKNAVTNRTSISNVRDKLLELKAQQAAKNQQEQEKQTSQTSSPFVTKNETKQEIKQETKPKQEIKTDKLTELSEDENDNDDNNDNNEDDETIPTYKGQKIKSDEDTMIPVFNQN